MHWSASLSIEETRGLSSAELTVFCSGLTRGSIVNGGSADSPSALMSIISTGGIVTEREIYN